MARQQAEEMTEEISKVEEGVGKAPGRKAIGKLNFWTSPTVVTIIQKLLAEMIGTYILVFMGCGSVVVNKIYGQVTLPGIAMTWGLTVMAIVYSIGHVSGAHLNPSVTIAFAVIRRFPYLQVPLYITAQLIGSLLASETLSWLFDVNHEAFFGTVPNGPHGRSFVVEIIITFLLMFVVCGVATDSRASGGFAGLAIGMTVVLDVMMAAPVSGASLNPARSIGPALVKHIYTGLWIYVLGPIIGAIAGGLAYNLLRFTDKSLIELTKIRNTSKNVVATSY